MATRMLRRGLPRVPGGEPWPPADASVEVDDSASGASASTAADLTAVAVTDGGTDATRDAAAPAAGHRTTDVVDAASADTDAVAAVVSSDEASSASVASSGAAAVASSTGARLRRGLPRVAGGEPWPPASIVAAVGTGASTASAAAPAAPAPAPAASGTPAATASPGQDAANPAAVATGTAGASASPAVAAEPGDASATVRRGLPRVPGGEPWPPAGTVPTPASTSVAASAAPASEPPAPSAPDSAVPTSAAASAPVPALADATPQTTAAVVPTVDLAAPLQWPQTVWNGRAARHITAAPDAGRRRPTWTQGIAVLFGAAALGVLAGAAVALVRALLSVPLMQDFLAAFPGEYEPAIPVEPGFAPWVNWAHFFNVFLMVLIIRSGLQVRTEKRPTVFWTPRNNAKGKISLNLWFHQALDILWLVNGVIFVVLLFVTGHWVRIVPTSWEVFPNALSAALQYVSFDWPHENGWNNYNSLQQLAYFVTVFVAAPLAAVTGFRMSGLWPKKAERLSKAYPVEWARALHFPIMLYFVAFIIAHVALVMLTGFLRNLNHMFAAQDAATWTGFWVFVLSLVVIAGAWVAARPLVLAPIAKLFGKVSGR